MKFSLLLLILPLSLHAQLDSAALIQETENFQKELNEEYKDKSTSPLKPADLRKFKQHDFFPIDLSYVVLANLSLTPTESFKPIKTTSALVQEYRVFGIAHFQLHGHAYSLPVYQSKNLLQIPAYVDYLFLPFTDLTTGDESYGGGRYLRLRIPKEGDALVINFNLAYNPYCAYNEKYSCPLVPKENDLPVAIRAGVRMKPK